jgi:hypothetical protein
MASILLSGLGTLVLLGTLWMVRNRGHARTSRPLITPALDRWPFAAGLRNLAQRANSSLRFRTAQQEAVAYQIWNKKLPVTGRVLEQIRRIAKSNEPFSGLLVSTHPPTIKIMENGTIPVVTRLIPTEDFHAKSLNEVPHEALVATFHTHRSDLSVFEHDERIFKLVDALAGPKIHIVGSSRGLRFYIGRGGPASVTRDRNEEVR